MTILPRKIAAVPRSLRDPSHVLFAAAAVWILASSLLLPPRMIGDSAEYQMMAESLARHLSPEMQARDVTAMAAKELRYHTRLDLAALYRSYFESGGAWYCYHFWGYSLACVPAKWLLRALRVNDLLALQLTNAVVFLWGLYQALFGTIFDRRGRLVLGLLFLFSPVAWFVPWSHPEAPCAALVLVAVLWAAAGRRHGPILCAALAALQNPPLVLLTGVLWIRAWAPRMSRWREDRRGALRALLRSSAAAAPALLSPLFFLWKFGTPSMVARYSANPGLMSLRRALELFVDLNLGLLPYVPVTLALFAVAVLAALRRPRNGGPVLAALVVLGLMAYACTATHNWNHGTAGPSRYAVWMLPLILVVVVHWLDGAWAGVAWQRQLATGLAALAVLSQGFVLVARGGLLQGDDSLVHSWAARTVLRSAPALYNPSPEIFVSRTNHVPSLEGYAVYRDGGCRKARAGRADGERLRRLCGFLPEGADGPFASLGPTRRWTYVDY